MPVSWSQYQKDIFEAIETIHNSGKDLVIEAYAGTGKSTTMVEAVDRYIAATPSAKVLTCAFNKKNAVDLDGKLRDLGLDWKQAQAKTLNSVGLATCKKGLGRGIQVDPGKGRKIAKRIAGAYRGSVEIDGLAAKVRKLASLAKHTLRSDLGALRKMCFQYWICDDVDQVGPICEMAQQALEESKADKSCVDFDDQVWFPYVFKLWPWKFDLVIVDECQDMNPAQLWLARRSVKKTGQLIAVGDSHQAIYAWRGADSGFMKRMIDELGANTLPLPVTYRCATSIVEEAKVYVPGFTAMDNAREGEVDTVTMGNMLDEARPGDFILSRTNAPLMGICLEFLREGRRAVIQGRDLFTQLKNLVALSGCGDLDAFRSWLDTYQLDEVRKLEEIDAEEEVIVALRDRCECLRILSAERKTSTELLQFLDELFGDDDNASVITLATAHRSKGLERDRVWLLSETFKAGRGGQEANCLYVAITRAKSSLFYVV